MSTLAQHQIENRLKQLRERQGLKPADLARLLDVNERTVRRWERGWAPRPIQMVRLSRLLGEPVHFIWIFDSIRTGPVVDLSPELSPEVAS